MNSLPSMAGQFVFCVVGPHTLAIPAAAIAGVGTVEAADDEASMIDLADALGVEVVETGRHVVRIKTNGSPLALIVHGVRGTRKIAPESRSSLPSGAGAAVASAFAGVICLEGVLAPVLNVAALFGFAGPGVDKFPKPRWDDLPPVRTRLGKILAFPAGETNPGEKPALYGINMSSVIELTPLPAVQPIPLAEPPVRGWIEWRGRPLLVREMAGAEDITDLSRARLAVLRAANGEPHGLVLPGTMKILSVNAPNRPCPTPPIPKPAPVQGWVEFRDEYLGLLRGA